MKLTIAMTMMLVLIGCGCGCGGGEQPKYANGDGSIFIFREQGNWDGTGRLASVSLMLTHPDHPHCGSLPLLGSSCDDGTEDEAIVLVSSECDKGCTATNSFDASGSIVFEVAYSAANHSRLKVTARDTSGREWSDSHQLPLPE